MKAVAVAAREGQEALSAEVAALEERLAALEAVGKKASPKGSAGKGGVTPEGDG
jgi:BMFP domain-containing protein YqiC